MSDMRLFLRIRSQRATEHLEVLYNYKFVGFVCENEFIIYFSNPDVDSILSRLSTAEDLEILETWIEDESSKIIRTIDTSTSAKSCLPLIETEDHWIKLRSNLSFGSGQHPTTQLCIDLMKELYRHFDIDTVFDLGTGSGILSLYAAMLGAKRVLAVDVDMNACMEALFNVAKNQLQNKIIVANGSYSVAKPFSFDLILANLLKDTLLNILPSFTQILKPSAFAIVSGATESQMKCIPFEEMNLSAVSIRTRQGWACALLRKRS